MTSLYHWTLQSLQKDKHRRTTNTTYCILVLVWTWCRSEYKNTLLAASWPFEVINCHHLPSNTHAAAQTGSPRPPAWEVSHLLLCWYHSSGSLAKINQIFWKALYPLLRYLTDVRQTWLHLSLWRMLGCWTWTNASIPAEAAGIDKHGPSVSILYFSVVAKPFPKGFLFINSLQRSKGKQCRLH